MELLRPNNDAAYAGKSVSFTGTAGATAAFPIGPEGVVVWADSACYVRIGPSDANTATSADTPIPANTPIAFHAPYNTGKPWTVSFIRISASGTGYAKPINKE